MTRCSSQQGRAQRNLEHVFTLLSAVLPREPLQVAFHGIRSADVALRSLAVEYLDGVLPEPLRAKLWALVDAAPRPTAERPPPKEVLEELRRSAQLPIVRPGAALHRPPAMLSSNLTCHGQPSHSECDVEPGEDRHCHGERGPNRDEPGRQHVADAREERVDRGLGLVLRLARRRQEQRLSDRVLDRVVRGVLENLSAT